MKRFFLFFVVLMGLLLFVSADAPVRYGLKPGRVAPAIVCGDSTLSAASSVPQQYTLLHFWASYDAPSRIANIQYDRVVEQCNSNRLRYIAVSYEHNERLYAEILKRDSVVPHTQYYDKAGSKSSTFARYRLKEGFATYLIDANGTIIDCNPTPQSIEKLLGK